MVLLKIVDLVRVHIIYTFLVETISTRFYWLTCRNQKLVENKPQQQRQNKKLQHKRLKQRRSTQNCKRCTFLENLRTITQEGSMKTRQMTHFFLSTFSALTVCNIHFYIWKWSKFIFLWSHLWPILVCKIHQFWAKATNLDSSSYFSRK